MRDSGLSESLSLAWMLAKRDLKNRYASSYAGVAWNVGVPLLYALINAVVFSILMSGRMGARYNDVPFPLFYFVPFSLFGFFSDVVLRSTFILKEYAYLINKIAFPFWVLPLVPIASALLSQGIMLAIIGVLMIQNGIPPAHTALLYVPIWLIAVMLTLGTAYAVSAVAVYVRDLAQIVPVIVTIIFWLTPILYPPALVETKGALWVRNVVMNYNPFYYLVEMSRQAVFGTAPIARATMVNMGLLSMIAFTLGFGLFRKLKSGFADVL
jgi:ABC-type polysaccharide/polyol phosphate export permease